MGWGGEMRGRRNGEEGMRKEDCGGGGGGAWGEGGMCSRRMVGGGMWWRRMVGGGMWRRRMPPPHDKCL